MKAYVITDLLAHIENEYKALGFKQHAEAIHRAISIIRGAGSEDDDPISEPARGQIFPLLHYAGLSLEDFKNHLRRTYGICSTKAIPWGLYDEICDWLTALGKARECSQKQAVFQEQNPSEAKQSSKTPHSTVMQAPHRRHLPKNSSYGRGTKQPLSVS